MTLIGKSKTYRGSTRMIADREITLSLIHGKPGQVNTDDTDRKEEATVDPTGQRGWPAPAQ
jgi:hypothetical protein